MNKTQKRIKALKIIQGNKYKFQSCLFIKRTNGEPRKMWFRYDPPDKWEEKGDWEYGMSQGLLTVQDWEKRSVRMINLDGLIVIKAGGERYLFFDVLEKMAEEVEKKYPNHLGLRKLMGRIQEKRNQQKEDNTNVWEEKDSDEIDLDGYETGVSGPWNKGYRPHSA